MPNGTSKGENAPKLVQTGSHTRGVLILGRATAALPDNRGKKDKRGKDDDECQWWEEGCNGVAMDAINNQLGATERQLTGNPRHLALPLFT